MIQFTFQDSFSTQLDNCKKQWETRNKIQEENKNFLVHRISDRNRFANSSGFSTNSVFSFRKRRFSRPFIGIKNLIFLIATSFLLSTLRYPNSSTSHHLAQAANNNYNYNNDDLTDDASGSSNSTDDATQTDDANAQRDDDYYKLNDDGDDAAYNGDDDDASSAAYYSKERGSYTFSDDDSFHWNNNIGFDGVSILPLSCIN